jgi:hypothetical protein
MVKSEPAFNDNEHTTLHRPIFALKEAETSAEICSKKI